MGSLTGAWQLGVGGKREWTDMSAMQSRATRLEAVLTRAFSPTLLRVVDDSARHAGHAGAQPGGETHYSVLLVSDAFRGVGRLARSRAVHAALAQEFAGGMHALSLTLRTPEEADSASELS
jgi:stress-induced morphogen